MNWTTPATMESIEFPATDHEGILATNIATFASSPLHIQEHTQQASTADPVIYISSLPNSSLSTSFPLIEGKTRRVVNLAPNNFRSLVNCVLFCVGM
jgi:hypothetical protein